MLGTLALRAAVAVAALCLSAGPAGAQEPIQHRVLILNSYHPHYPWTQDVVRGVFEALTPARAGIDIRIEYMDTKANRPSEEYFGKIYDLLRYKYDKTTFDAVITTDNNALTFAIDYHDRLFKGAPIVFCGVNNYAQEMLKGDTRATGVVEEPDIAGTVEAALKINPGLRKMVFIADDTETGLLNLTLAQRAQARFLGRVEFVYLRSTQYTMPELIQEVGKLQGDSALLFLDFYYDRAGTYWPLERGLPLLSKAAPVPLYTHSSVYKGLDALGGKLTTGYSQGYNAGEKVQRLLAGEKVTEIPVLLESPSEYIFEYPQMARFGIRPEQLPPGSTILNQPESFYQRYKRLVWTTVGVVVVLSALVLLLGVNVIRRRQAENRLRRQRNLLQSVLEHIPHAIFWKDRNRVYLGGNTRFLQMCGVASPQELVGKTDYELVWEKDQADFYRDCDAKVMDRNEPMIDLEEPARLSGGKQATLLTSKVPLVDEAGRVTGVLGIATDITERKALAAERQLLQEQLHQARKMEAVGQLAGGVAHDFNNILTAIQGNAELLANALTDRTEDEVMARQILQAAHRAADLVRQLLAFARQGKFQAIEVNVHHILDEVAQLLGRTIDRQIDILRDYHAPRDTVIGDPSQIQNAFLNLAVNARDAMPDGGQLTFATRVVEVDEAQAQKHDPFRLSPGPYIEVAVRDTGLGMSTEVLEHVFEPFFTTKGPDKGTGLGLSSVYGVVTSHHGAVEASSEVGKGSEFRVLLPLGEQLAPPGLPAEPAQPKGGQGVVLVVDDEEIVRNFAARALHRLGYEVVTASDGVEAMEYFRQHHAQLDAVLLDLVMPRLDGRDTFHQMRTLDPAVHVILSTGYTENPLSDEILADGAVGLLSKPFQMEELAAMVAKAVART